MATWGDISDSDSDNDWYSDTHCSSHARSVTTTYRKEFVLKDWIVNHCTNFLTLKEIGRLDILCKEFGKLIYTTLGDFNDFTGRGTGFRDSKNRDGTHSSILLISWCMKHKMRLWRLTIDLEPPDFSCLNAYDDTHRKSVEEAYVASMVAFSLSNSDKDEDFYFDDSRSVLVVEEAEHISFLAVAEAGSLMIDDFDYDGSHDGSYDWPFDNSNDGFNDIEDAWKSRREENWSARREEIFCAQRA